MWLRDEQMYQHIGDLPRRLPQHNTAAYDYVTCPPLVYPELKDEMWCHRYYLRNLCDTDRFPDWPIVDHIPFLQVSPLAIVSRLDPSKTTSILNCRTAVPSASHSK